MYYLLNFSTINNALKSPMLKFGKDCALKSVDYKDYFTI
jgi:hypothetical protein